MGGLLVLALLAVPGLSHGALLPVDWESDYGTALNLWDTSTSGLLNIGFDFEFYGEVFNTVKISGNGYFGIGDDVANSGNPDHWPYYS